MGFVCRLCIHSDFFKSECEHTQASYSLKSRFLSWREINNNISVSVGFSPMYFAVLTWQSCEKGGI